MVVLLNEATSELLDIEGAIEPAIVDRRVVGEGVAVLPYSGPHIDDGMVGEHLDEITSHPVVLHRVLLGERVISTRSVGTHLDMHH